MLYLIEILHQTTTSESLLLLLCQLYLIEILHQTTTSYIGILGRLPLYLIEILHQTTTLGTISHLPQRCILSKFYIKPQQYRPYDISRKRCILSKFYIKPQLVLAHACLDISCILSKFYIKPQQKNPSDNQRVVVSYRNSTSNHNIPGIHPGVRELYLIEILHQTTTCTSLDL